MPFLMILALAVQGCLPKQNAQLAQPQQNPEPEPMILSHGTTEGENPSAFESQTEPEPLPEDLAEEGTGDVEESSEPAEPQAILESALHAYQQSQEHWKSGRMDEALSNLDRAFSLVLRLDGETDLDILQEKDDLRYLISKRIVEIYASRRTVVGNLERSIPIVMNEHVEREIELFQTREKGFFLDSYARSGIYREMILEALKKEGLPEQLSWLPLIESGFKTSALSRARALGLWQFIPSTGYRFGLSRDQWVDERMDPEKATTAAIQYLLELHNLFGDWLTALAAYNCGERRVLRTIKAQRINYLDNFWDLYNQLPRETARYVPRFLATLIILKDPAKYGLSLPEPNPAQSFEVVQISKPVSLRDLERLAETGENSFKSLNPELRYGVTPDKPYSLKAPQGAASKVLEGIASLPKWQLPEDAAMVHVVRRGETLSAIAKRYRTSTSGIVRANGLASQHRIWPGQRLKIPGRGKPVIAGDAVSGGDPVTHVVVRGDSLWKIAKQYGATVEQIKAWNQLQSDWLKLGQKLTIRPATSASARIYYVQKGDTMAKIANKHGVRLQALLDANHMSRRDRIYPNQPITLPD